MNHMTTSDDSYYSDYAYDCEYEGNDDSWASSEDDADDDDADNDDANDAVRSDKDPMAGDDASSSASLSSAYSARSR